MWWRVWCPKISLKLKSSFTLQDAGHRVLRAVYPNEATARLPEDVTRRNAATMEALLSGDAYRDPVWRDLVTGSRAEGLGMKGGWGHEPADTDIMLLNGHCWGVHIADEEDATIINGAGATESDGESFLQMTDADVPCFCRVKVNGRIQDLADRIGQGIARGTTTPEEIGANILMVGVLSVAALLQPGVTLMSFLSDVSFFSLFGRFFTPAQRAQLYHSTTADSYRTMDSLRRRLPNVISSYWSIGKERVMECFCLWNGIQYLSSVKVLRLLSDPRHSQIHQGPSQTVGQVDLVPALVCSRPFPCMLAEDGYLSRSHCPRWPTSEALADIGVLPGVIVPTGNTDNSAHELERGYSLSPHEQRLSRDMPEWDIVPTVIPEYVNHELEWRYSFSTQELRLSHDMPEWVRTGYRAAKYTFKSVCKKNLSTSRDNGSRFSDTRHSAMRLLGIALGFVYTTRTTDGRKHVSSYHLKTVLLWCLEQESTWQEECPFLLMLILLKTLDHHLVTGILPHYFNPDCNLLQSIPKEELDFARSCAGEILCDPANSIINAPSDTKRIKKGGVDLSVLLEEFTNAMQQSGV